MAKRNLAGKMPDSEKEYPTVEAARIALRLAGFLLTHTPPGAPGLWLRGDVRRAVAQPKDGGPWRVVAYPERLLRAAEREQAANLATCAAARAVVPAKPRKRRTATQDEAEAPTNKVPKVPKAGAPAKAARGAVAGTWHLLKAFPSGVRASMCALVPKAGIAHAALLDAAHAKHEWEEGKVRALTSWLRKNGFLELRVEE